MKEFARTQKKPLTELVIIPPIKEDKFESFISIVLENQTSKKDHGTEIPEINNPESWDEKWFSNYE